MKDLGNIIGTGMTLAGLAVASYLIVSTNEKREEREVKKELIRTIDTPEERERMVRLFDKYDENESWYAFNSLKESYPELKNLNRNRLVYELDQLRELDLGNMSDDDFSVYLSENKL
jgi:hypothetical protein